MKKLFPLGLIFLLIFTSAAMSQAKKKTVRKKKKAAPTRDDKLMEQYKALQDISDVLSGKSNKPLLTPGQMKPRIGGVLINPNGLYTNYITGYSVKFPEYGNILKGNGTFMDDFRVSYAIDGEARILIIGRDEFLCASSEDCANNSVRNMQQVDGFESLDSQEMTVQGLSAHLVKYKMSFPEYGTSITEEVHVLRGMGNKNILYTVKLSSSEKSYETDKKIFDDIVATMKFIKTKS